MIIIANYAIVLKKNIMHNLFNLIVALFLVTPLKAQDYKIFSYPFIGWEIAIPSHFEIMDSLMLNEIYIEDYGKKDGKSNDTINLIIATNPGGFLDALEASVIKRKNTRNSGWLVNFHQYLNYAYERFKAIVPSLDTSSSIENVQGINFQKFTMETDKSGKYPLTVSIYGAFIRGYDFYFVITYTDEIKGKELLDLFKQSNFH